MSPLLAASPWASPMLIAQASNPSLGRLLLEMLPPMIIIFTIFYFLYFRPMGKRRQAHEDLLAGLEKGTKVITNGGFYGKVVKVDGEVVTLELTDNVKVRINKNAIAGLENAAAEKGN